MPIIPLLFEIFLPEANACGNSMKRHKKEPIEVKLLSGVQDNESIFRAVLKKHYHSFQQCAHKAGNNKDYIYSVSYSVRVAQGGKIERVRSTKKHFSEEMHNCIADVLTENNFPKKLVPKTTLMEITFNKLYKSKELPEDNPQAPERLSKMKLQGSYQSHLANQSAYFSFTETDHNTGFVTLKQKVTDTHNKECDFSIQGTAQAITDNSLIASIHNNSYYCRLEIHVDRDQIEISKNEDCPMFTGENQDCSTKPSSSITFERKGKQY